LPSIEGSSVNERPWLLLETSARVGFVGLGLGAALAVERQLDGQRRHAQDLAPAMAEVLRVGDWNVSDVEGVAVSLGPGSYTGLRVGVMAAKAFAFAAGCALVGIPTFEAIVRQSRMPSLRLDIVADALKDKLYVQRFARRRAGDDWSPENDLTILSQALWLANLTDDIAVSGPGAALVEERLPKAIVVAPPAQRAAGLQALLDIARMSAPAADRAVILSLEPIYHRPSSAEEQWSHGV
jgi:tRNA threonylcarbamoyladenosine biosynthesis protein TsaB